MKIVIKPYNAKSSSYNQILCIFSQMVKEPTHLEGNLLYHTYLHDAGRVNDYSIELQSKYFTDPKGIAIVVRNSGSIKESKELE